MPSVPNLTLAGIPTRIAIYIGGGLLLIAAFWLAMHFYGQGRYNDGVHAEDAKWQAATEQLKQDAGNSATNADANAAERLQNIVNSQAADQAAVNQAEAEGRSPLDAIFGN